MIYLDNAATTKVLPEVLAIANKYMGEVYGNPSSSHSFGLEAKKAVDTSAKIIAKAIGAKAEQLVFTAGATESNNMVILQPKWLESKRKSHFITTKTEHPSVLNCFLYLEKLGHEVDFLTPDKNGLVSAKQVLSALKPNTELISIIYGNNEIGVLNPLKEIAEALKAANYKGKIHSDATQALAKIAINLKTLDLDYLSASGHKLHAPKGVGLLYTKSAQIEPLFQGGGQQRAMRSGTLNTAGITAFAKAITLVSEQRVELAQRYKFFADIMQNEIQWQALGGKIIAENAPRLEHIYSIGFKNIKSEVLLNAMAAKSIMISSGSACSTSSQKLSSVLEAIGLDDDYIDGVIRVSFSMFTTEAEVRTFVETLNKVVPKLQRVTK